jgi:hypothetical protein
MKKGWTEIAILRFALNRAEPQRLFNNLLGLMAPLDALRGAIRYAGNRLEMGIDQCALLHLRGL